MSAPPQTVSAMPNLPAHAPRPHVSAPGSELGPPRVLDKWVCLVGGRADCDLSVQHVDVSRIHCALVNTGDGLAVIDLCSRLGTFVNGKKTHAAALGRRDKLRVGPVELAFHWPGGGAGRRPSLRLRHKLVLELNGKRSELTELPAVIGRRSGCDFLVDTPDVSGAHTLLIAIGGRPAAYDLGSRSGTIVNGQRVNFAWLRNGDRLVIGGETLFVGGAAAAKPEPKAETEAVAEQLEATFAETQDPGQIDKLLHLVQSNIASFSGRFSEKVEDVGRREAELGTRAQAVEQGAREVEGQRRQIQQQAVELEALVEELKRREHELVLGEARMAIRKVSLVKAGSRMRKLIQQMRAERERVLGERERWEHLAGEISAARDELAAERAEFERRTAAAREQQATTQARQKRLSSAERKLAAREQALAARDEELGRREQALADLEQRSQAMAEKMQAFQETLAQASELFDGEAAPNAEPAAPSEGPAEPAAAKPSASPAARAGRGGSRNGSKAGGLPAPVIEQPIFVASAGREAQREAPSRPKSWRRLWS